MKAPMRILLAAVAAIAPLAAGAQDPPKPASPKWILWARTWEGALREASIRNVPIYILVSIGEG
jgi:hypothetical protein